MSGDAHCPSEATAVDTLFDTLSHHIRREVIRYFEQEAEGDTATLRELVVRISEQNTQVDSHQTEVSLAQIHLPKLADRGWIAYDRTDGQIRYYGNDRVGQRLGRVCEIFDSSAC